jgi:hypothetical protein
MPEGSCLVREISLKKVLKSYKGLSVTNSQEALVEPQRQTHLLKKLNPCQAPPHFRHALQLKESSPAYLARTATPGVK